MNNKVYAEVIPFIDNETGEIVGEACRVYLERDGKKKIVVAGLTREQATRLIKVLSQELNMEAA